MRRKIESAASLVVPLTDSMDQKFSTLGTLGATVEAICSKMDGVLYKFPVIVSSDGVVTL